MINLILGDCLEKMKNMDDASINTIFTSPPYNRKRDDAYTNYSDTINDYFAFLDKAMQEFLRIAQYMIHINLQSNYYNRSEIAKFVAKYSDRLSEVIIWEKTNPRPASKLSVTNSYETVYVFSKGLEKGRPISLRARHTYAKNIITTSVNSGNTHNGKHKAVMSKTFCDAYFNRFILPEKSILDPFMGLGTTGMTCIDNGNDFTGIEIDQEYFNIAKERLIGGKL